MRTEREELIELLALAEEIEMRAKDLDKRMPGVYILKRYIAECVNVLHELRRGVEDQPRGLFDK